MFPGFPDAYRLHSLKLVFSAAASLSLPAPSCCSGGEGCGADDTLLFFVGFPDAHLTHGLFATINAHCPLLLASPLPTADSFLGFPDAVYLKQSLKGINLLASPGFQLRSFSRVFLRRPCSRVS